MSQLPTLIADLALILICAGVMTLLFKKLKQPLVLGYVVAGFLASPHMPYTPSVMDTANIKTWADIGVIFLLFALGLEFSFKKIVKVGGSAIIAACTIIFCMILLGIGVGMGFGWHRMDSLFLGGMIAMSSTTIIYKAFDDLGLRKKHLPRTYRDTSGTEPRLSKSILTKSGQGKRKNSPTIVPIGTAVGTMQRLPTAEDTTILPENSTITMYQMTSGKPGKRPGKNFSLVFLILSVRFCRNLSCSK